MNIRIHFQCKISMHTCNILVINIRITSNNIMYTYTFIKIWKLLAAWSKLNNWKWVLFHWEQNECTSLNERQSLTELRVPERSNKLELLRVNSNGFWMWHHSAMSNGNTQPHSVYQTRRYKIKLKLYMMRRISFAFLIFSVAPVATPYQVETMKSLNEDLGVLNCQN